MNKIQFIVDQERYEIKIFRNYFLKIGSHLGDGFCTRILIIEVSRLGALCQRLFDRILIQE